MVCQNYRFILCLLRKFNQVSLSGFIGIKKLNEKIPMWSLFDVLVNWCRGEWTQFSYIFIMYF